MSWLTRGLKHAFEVGPSGPVEPTPTQQIPVDWFCREIVRRHLTTPAIAFLELFHPLNYIGSQFGHAVSPGVWAVVRDMTYERYQQFLAFLEQRGSIEYICRRIEHFEEEYEQQRDLKQRKQGRPNEEEPNSPTLNAGR